MRLSRCDYNDIGLTVYGVHVFENLRDFDKYIVINPVLKRDRQFK